MNEFGSSKAVESETLFWFPKGLPGFEFCQHFHLIHVDGAPLGKLIAVEDEHIGFVVMRAETILAGYTQQVILDPESTKILGGDMENDEQLSQELAMQVWVILTLDHQDVLRTTANLRAPLVFNIKKHIGMQIILNDEQLAIRHALYMRTDDQEVTPAKKDIDGENALEEGAAG